MLIVPVEGVGPAVIAGQLHLKELPLFKVRYNIAPSQSVGTIRMMPSHTRTPVMLLPAWYDRCLDLHPQEMHYKPYGDTTVVGATGGSCHYSVMLIVDGSQ